MANFFKAFTGERGLVSTIINNRTTGSVADDIAALFFASSNTATAATVSPFFSAAGQFTLRTTTGAQSITGLGFQPKAILFFSQQQFDAATDDSIEQGSFLGCATAATEEWCVSHAVNPTEGFTSLQRSDDRCINYVNPDTAVNVFVADFTSMDSDGFTINVSTADATVQRIVMYMAIGGTSVSAKAGVKSYSGSTGAQATTGVGFQPKAVLLAHGPQSNFTGIHTAQDSVWGVGWALSSSSRVASCIAWDDASNPSEIKSRQRSDQVYFRISSAGTLQEAADFTSMDSDGFTVNWGTASGASISLNYLALGGIAQYAMNTVTEPGSVGSQAVTGIGFRPDASLFTSVGFATHAANQDGSRQLFGAHAKRGPGGWGGSFASSVLDNTYTMGDPQGLQPEGYCISKSQTVGHNLLLRSEEFDNAVWDNDTGGSVSANSVTDPLGTSTADAYTFATSTIKAAYKSQTVTTDSTLNGWTYSIWAKTASGTLPLNLRIADASGGAIFQSPSFTLTTTWQRYSFTIGKGQQNAAGNSLTAAGGLLVGFQNGTAGSVYHLWGAQLNRHGYLPYTRTTTAAVDNSDQPASKARLLTYDSDGYTLWWDNVSGVSTEIYALSMGGPAGGTSVVLTGFGMTGLVGTVTVSGKASTTFDSTNMAAAANIGDVTESGAASTTLTGFGMTGSVGSVTQGTYINLAVTGFGMTASLGTPTLSISGSTVVTGFGMTGSVGTASSSVNAGATLSTLAGTGAVGSVEVSGAASVAVTGFQLDSGLGGVALQSGVAAQATGVQGTGAVGDVVPGISTHQDLVGVSATADFGNVGFVISGSTDLTGFELTGAVGEVIVFTGKVEFATGFEMVGLLGTTEANAGAGALLTGVEGVGIVGTTIANVVSGNVVSDGLEAVAQLGTFSVRTGARIPADDLEMISSLGVVGTSAWGIISDTQRESWSQIQTE